VTRFPVTRLLKLTAQQDVWLRKVAKAQSCAVAQVLRQIIDERRATK
jgi:hypothetical protein